MKRNKVKKLPVHKKILRCEKNSGSEQALVPRKLKHKTDPLLKNKKKTSSKKTKCSHPNRIFGGNSELITVTLTENGWSDSSIGTWDASKRITTLSKDIPGNTRLVFEISNVIIEGNQHIINGGSNDYDRDCPVVLKDLENITIRNLSIIYSVFGIIAEKVKNLTIQGCVFSQGKISINMVLCENTVIRDCEFRDLDNVPIIQHQGTSLVFSNNKVYCTRPSGWGSNFAMYIQYGNYIDVSNNLFKDYTSGICLYSLLEGKVEDNTFKNCGDSPVVAPESPNVIVRNNTIKYSKKSCKKLL